MRSPQPEGTKGSLKWMQAAVNLRPDLLQPSSLPQLTWVSPLRDDDFSEYRDAAFLARLGLEALTPGLRAFWPTRGPQWDGLATFQGGVVIAEAKAHLPELVSPPSAASPKSLDRILASFAQVQSALNMPPRVWHRTYYQFANRLAHLWWLRSQGVNAHLALIGFVGDEQLSGPTDPRSWQDAYAQANRELGLPESHHLSPFVHHLYPAVQGL